MNKYLKIAAVVAVSSMFLGCNNKAKEEQEEAGKPIPKTTTDTKTENAMKSAGDTVKENATKAGDAIKEGTQKAADATKEETTKAGDAAKEETQKAKDATK